jgi:uncharacterized protein (DUF1778 family)
MRVKPSIKQELQKAASVQEMTLTDYILWCCLGKPKPIRWTDSSPIFDREK